MHHFHFGRQGCEAGGGGARIFYRIEFCDQNNFENIFPLVNFLCFVVGFFFFRFSSLPFELMVSPVLHLRRFLIYAMHTTTPHIYFYSFLMSHHKIVLRSRKNAEESEKPNRQQWALEVAAGNETTERTSLQPTNISQWTQKTALSFPPLFAVMQFDDYARRRNKHTQTHALARAAKNINSYTAPSSHTKKRDKTATTCDKWWQLNHNSVKCTPHKYTRV